MIRFVLLFILFFSLISCVKTETTKISNNVKIVKYLLSDNKKKTIIIKYNKKFGQWFEVICSISESTLAENCIDNLEYTKSAKSKMNLLISQKDDNGAVQQAGSEPEQPSEPAQPSEPSES